MNIYILQRHNNRPDKIDAHTIPKATPVVMISYLHKHLHNLNLPSLSNLTAENASSNRSERLFDTAVLPLKENAPNTIKIK